VVGRPVTSLRGSRTTEEGRKGGFNKLSNAHGLTVRKLGVAASVCPGVTHPLSGEQIHTLLYKTYVEACVLLEVKYDHLATQWVYRNPPPKPACKAGLSLGP
jgi:hypothetical protein